MTGKLDEWLLAPRPTIAFTVDQNRRAARKALRGAWGAYGRDVGASSPDDSARDFHLDDTDHALIIKRLAIAPRTPDSRGPEKL